MDYKQRQSSTTSRSKSGSEMKRANTTEQLRTKQSWRGTSDPSRVDKYVDCDKENGWC